MHEFREEMVTKTRAFVFNVRSLESFKLALAFDTLFQCYYNNLCGDASAHRLCYVPLLSAKLVPASAVPLS